LNGKTLSRGRDYTFDYKKGKITILNKDAMNPSAKLEITYTIKNTAKIRKVKNSYVLPQPEMMVIMRPLSWNPDTRRFEIRAGEKSLSEVMRERIFYQARHDSNSVHIIVLRDGGYEVNGERVGRDDLEKVIREMLPKRKNTVNIEHEAEAPRQSLDFLDNIIRRVKPKSAVYGVIPPQGSVDEKAEEALFTKAWELFDQQRDEEGFDTLQKVVEMNPKGKFAPAALFSIADYYYNTQKYDDALKTYKELLARYPESDVAKKVPSTIRELNETMAYMEYEAAFRMFTEARAAKDRARLREAAEMFDKIARDYTETDSAAGAIANEEVIWEELGEWGKMLDTLERLIVRYGKDVPPELLKRRQDIKDILSGKKKPPEKPDLRK
jgi:hypothetical protein